MKAKMLALSALLATSTVMSGCATIVHGTTQRIGISSQPTGAEVAVDGNTLGKTPLFADLKRGSDHIVTITMPGYQPAQLTITKGLSGWAWGNIIFGGFIGLGIDFLTGGVYNLSPAQINAQLQKSGAKQTAYIDRKNGMAIIAVLKPDPHWHKIGTLIRG